MEIAIKTIKCRTSTPWLPRLETAINSARCEVLLKHPSQTLPTSFDQIKSMNEYHKSAK